MSNLRRRAAALHCAALLGLAALVLHQLRYLAGHGSGVDEALVTQGHGYLQLVVPLMASFSTALLAALLLASALERPAAGAPGRRPVGHPVGFALVVLAGFCAQELTEGMLSAGHPSGLDALLANRGWIALPLAGILGELVSLVLTGFGSLERRLAGTFARPRLQPAAPPHGFYTEPDVDRPARTALVFGLAPRAPPSLLAGG